MNDVNSFSKNNEFDKIKTCTFELEKNILDNCKSEYDFKLLLDDITLYSDYSLVNDEYVSITNNNKEEIKNKNELTPDELNKYMDPNNPYVILHHKDFKGLRSVEIFDVKDTDINKIDYEQDPLPALFYSSYDEIYNSFVKAIHCGSIKLDMKT